MSIIWEPCAAGARVLRVLGDSPCPAVPETVEGLPVTEIGPYCFADKPVKAGARRSGADTHEITGNFVEEVTLPDTVRVLDSAAFYNCRRLRRLTAGTGELTARHMLQSNATIKFLFFISSSSIFSSQESTLCFL